MRIRLMAAAAALGMTACAPGTPAPAPTPERDGRQTVPEHPAPSPVSQSPRDISRTLPARRAAAAWTDSAIKTLSRRDKVAQLIWPWILGDYVPQESAEWARLSRYVTDDHVGGFIVSVGAPVDIALKVNALQRMSQLPLLMSADVETGVGFRARGAYFLPNAIDLGGATNFPLQMALGAADDTALAYAMGRITALEARALGIHIAFGPVLDVNNNPANPVIGARSFGEDPKLTARMGAALVRGLQENGVLATGKHFPGHGDTETNSHLALASVTASRARLDSVELVPFRAAIAAGVGAIMTFHGYLPALDSAQIPATLSPRVMTSLLRDDLRFHGLLVTDAMTMAGVVNTFGDAEAAKRAIAAGADVLLMPTNTRVAIDAVIAGIDEGRYDEARIDRSVRRVLEMKHEFGLHRDRFVDLNNIRRVVGDSAHVAVANVIAERAFVLAKDSAKLVPLVQNGQPANVLSVTYARRAELSAGIMFDAELRHGVATLRSAYVNADEPAPNFGRVLQDAASADVVVVGSYVNVTSESATADAPRAFVAFMDSLAVRGTRVILVSFGSPYMLMQAPRVTSYALAWGGSAASQRAAARALIGEIPVTARLPISIPPSLAIGAGERRDAVAVRSSSPRD